MNVIVGYLMYLYYLIVLPCVMPSIRHIIYPVRSSFS